MSSSERSPSLATAVAEPGRSINMEGLGRIGLREVHESRSLTHRLVSSHCFDGVEEFMDVEQVPVVVAGLRRFLRPLPDGQDAEQSVARDCGGIT